MPKEVSVKPLKTHYFNEEVQAILKDYGVNRSLRTIRWLAKKRGVKPVLIDGNHRPRSVWNAMQIYKLVMDMTGKETFEVTGFTIDNYLIGEHLREDKPKENSVVKWFKSLFHK